MDTTDDDACPDDLCDFLEEFGSGPTTWDSSNVPADDEPDRRTFVPVPHEADVNTVDWISTAARHRLKAERRRVKRLMQAPWSDEAGGLRVAIDIGRRCFAKRCRAPALQDSHCFTSSNTRAQHARSWRLARVEFTRNTRFTRQ